MQIQIFAYKSWRWKNDRIKMIYLYHRQVIHGSKIFLQKKTIFNISMNLKIQTSNIDKT